MTIAHHPPDAMIAAFVAGTLDPGQHLAIATHLAGCPQCRGLARSLEAIGGSMIESLPPAPMSAAALAITEARLGAPVRPAPAPPPTVSPTEVPGLPAYARRYAFGAWRWVAPKVHVRPIRLPQESDTRVFLLRSGPGTAMLQHTHSGLEMTCVLSGAFRQGGDRYGPGDFDFGDDDTHHQPIVETGQECLCLVAMQGGLRLDGMLGRIMQPFIRL